MKTIVPVKEVNGVYNDGASIKIVFDGGAIQINKSQIKTIDTVRNDVVRIDIGAGAMKNIYIRLNEVQYPKDLHDVIALKNYINGLLLQNAYATEAKQDAALVEFKAIKHLLTEIKQVLVDTKTLITQQIPHA